MAELTELEQTAASLADSIAPLDEIKARPTIIGTNENQYYMTLGDYGLEFDHAYIQAWNKEGKKVKVFLKKGEAIKVEFPAPTPPVYSIEPNAPE